MDHIEATPNDIDEQPPVGGSDSEEIPPLLPLHQMPAVHTEADLFVTWRRILGPLGFSRRVLWLLVLDRSGHLTPIMTQIDKVPEAPDAALFAGLMQVCSELLETVPGGSVALLLSRPGRRGPTLAECGWAAALEAAASAARVRTWRVHFANDAALRVFSPDDLVGAP